MQLIGAAKEPEVGAALSFLDECFFSFENWEKQPYGGASPVYYWYYITQAKFHSGGDRWTNWNQQFQPELIKRQVVIPNAIADAEGKMRDIGYWDSPSAKEHRGGGGGAGCGGAVSGRGRASAFSVCGYLAEPLLRHEDEGRRGDRGRRRS